MSMPTAAAASDSPRTLWLLLGKKAGDNNQLRALAEALSGSSTAEDGAVAWRVIEKHFNYQPWEIVSNRLLRVTLKGVDHRHSDRLEAPWPDLVITAGRRNEPIARWIKQQSAGRTRLVHMGRPWAPLDAFDLIVTTPQYFLPERANILHNDLPLHCINHAAIERAIADWQGQLQEFPPPVTAVLLGGNSGPYTFSRAKGFELGRWVNARVREQRGSLFVTSSARTPPQALHAFQEMIDVPAYFYRWNANDSDNPYLAYLGLADQFVVTGESMSMLTEAAMMDKPLYIYDLGDERLPWWCYLSNFRPNALVHRLGMLLGPKRMRRDVGNIQRALVANGRAMTLQGSSGIKVTAASRDDLQHAVKRVKDLFGE